VDTKWMNDYRFEEKKHAELLSIPALKTWHTALPGAKDYDSHSTELKIDALPAGAYALIISAKENFSKEDNIISYAIFQVSRLSAVSSTTQGFALDRKTGMPLQNAHVDFYRNRYNQKNRS